MAYSFEIKESTEEKEGISYTVDGKTIEMKSGVSFKSQAHDGKTMVTMTPSFEGTVFKLTFTPTEDDKKTGIKAPSITRTLKGDKLTEIKEVDGAECKTVMIKY